MYSVTEIKGLAYKNAGRFNTLDEAKTVLSMLKIGYILELETVRQGALFVIYKDMTPEQQGQLQADILVLRKIHYKNSGTKSKEKK